MSTNTLFAFLSIALSITMIAQAKNPSEDSAVAVAPVTPHQTQAVGPFDAVDLAVAAGRYCVSLPPDAFDEVILGCGAPPAHAPNPSRVAGKACRPGPCSSLIGAEPLYGSDHEDAASGRYRILYRRS